MGRQDITPTRSNHIHAVKRQVLAERLIRRPEWPKFKPLLSIVVPVYNESENVLALVKRVHAAVGHERVEMLFVDDSRDTKTVELVALARMIYRSSSFDVHVFHRTGEQRWGGLSGAVADGMRSARSDKILVMDGDLQHPPEIIPAMLRASLIHDFVVASRYIQGGSASGLDGGIRHFVSRGSTFAAKLFFPLRLRPVSDPMTGFFIVDRSKIDRSRLRPRGFKILLELLVTHPELSVAEVPMKFGEREAGESHGSVKQGMEFFGQLIQLKIGQFSRNLLKVPKPVQFAAIGGSVFLFGMALLYGMVDILGWAALLANAIQLVVTFMLNYVLNRNITWRDRVVTRLAMHKFLVSRAATTLVNYLLFAWLVTLQFKFSAFGQNFDFSVHYLLANVIALVGVMALNYEISDRWAFAEPRPKTEKATRRLRWSQIEHETNQKRRLPLALTLASILAVMTIISIAFAPNVAIPALLVTVSIALFIQASIEVWRMIYTYRDPESVDKLRFPVAQETHQEKFCIIVPARHEDAVLAHTLQQLEKQTHPNVHIISVICDDDRETLDVAYRVAENSARIEVVEYPLAEGVKPSKPLQLNYVLEQTKDAGYTVVGIVDAEDTVHPLLLERIDAAFRDQEVGIVQGGVQLMNHHSSWFSLHNVLEYYRWFNSAMAFQADSQFMPLGGNTIFIRDDLLRKAGGWPVTLTEDCSLGVLLSSRFNAKTAVYYEPELATREETPDTLTSLFKQRVRWNQGFFHEWLRGVWQELPNFRQRLLAGYVLLGPVILATIGVFMVLSILAAFLVDAPVGLVLVMYLPFIPVCLLGFLNAVFLYDFGKAFGRKIKLNHYIMLFLTQLVYQFVLNAAAFWAVVRELRGDQSWYKTSHSGSHRSEDSDSDFEPLKPGLTLAPAIVAATAGTTDALPMEADLELNNA